MASDPFRDLTPPQRRAIRLALECGRLRTELADVREQLTTAIGEIAVTLGVTYDEAFQLVLDQVSLRIRDRDDG